MSHPNMRTIASAGEKAARTGAKVFPALGRMVGVISGTMAALTAAGWFITRANEKKQDKK